MRTVAAGAFEASLTSLAAMHRSEPDKGFESWAENPPVGIRIVMGILAPLLFYLFFYIMRDVMAEKLRAKRLRSSGTKGEASIKKLKREKKWNSDTNREETKYFVSYDFLATSYDPFLLSVACRVHARDRKITQKHYEALKEGDTVEVLYDPERPAYCRLTAAAEDDMSTGQLCFFLGQLIVGFFVLMLFSLGLPLAFVGPLKWGKNACPTDCPWLALAAGSGAVWLSAFWLDIGGSTGGGSTGDIGTLGDGKTTVDYEKPPNYGATSTRV